MEPYLDTIKQVISQKSGVESDEITKASYFEDDLNIGGMELGEIFDEIESHLGVSLSPNLDDITPTNDDGEEEEKENKEENKEINMEEIETVGDLLDIITEKLD